MTQSTCQLKTGMFVMPIHDPAKPLSQCLAEDMQLAVQCDQLGMDEFWVGEHHSSTVENIVMPEMFLAKAAALTSSIRLGPAPICLQYHHPVHVANRLALLDHLSDGRLNVCFGPGAIPTDMEVYGVDPADTAGRVAESIEMIMQIWSSDPPYHLPGTFWNIHMQDQLDLEMGLGPLHKPLQQPHPPISVPSISPQSSGLAAAAAQGFSLFSHHMISEETLAKQWSWYCSSAEQADRQATPANWRVSRNILVAETTEQARQLARDNSLGACIEYILELTRRGPGVGMWKRNSEQSDDDCNLDYFLDEVIIAGDPDHVADRIRQLRERVGDFGTLVLVAHDWDDSQTWQRSVELFQHDVLPQLI